MNPMKRVGLAVLVFIVGALFAASPALGDKPLPILSGKLSPLPPEPKARGVWSAPCYGSQMDVSCQSLTPGKEYLVVAEVVLDDGVDDGGWWLGTFLYTYATADEKGKLNADLIVPEPWFLMGVDSVWIKNDEGNRVLQWYLTF